ncbi:MAG: hypothetical protein NZM37_00230 [Sandaracinaceae bacterium]|nr:hypothetical protein [Sandaracinaceae bacterium]MDW8246439.1 hypothetical protein [Sandaracinaceae bacterium]
MVFHLSGCSGPERPRLGGLERGMGRVGQTLRVSIPVINPSGLPLRYRAKASRALPAFESTTSISGSPGGGEFRWTPLVSHVGLHDIEIAIQSPEGEVYDRRLLVVEILPSLESAPVFVEPGAGGTYDLSRDPCVRFGIEVRDEDSPMVMIRSRGELPRGASLEMRGPKSAAFEWCPTSDQIAASERWTIGLEADDGDHEPVPHDYVVILRSEGGANCPGEAPSIRVLAPEGGARVQGNPGYQVSVEVNDDRGLREPPILYWTTEMPSDPSRPDITGFQQELFEREAGNRYLATIPPLGLGEGESREVFFIVSATDNDDPEGTACDHRTETPLSSFYALGGRASMLATCSRCRASSECASGICVPLSGGARCLEGCSGGSCSGSSRCATVTTSEGARVQACAGPSGNPNEACAQACMNDRYEPNDSMAQATPLRSPIMGQICRDDRDLFRIDGASEGSEVEVLLDSFRSSEGDLDMRLLDAMGRIVGTSAGITDMERIVHCARSSGPLYAEVYGFLGAQNPYRIQATLRSASCCVDDASEPDNALGTARLVSGSDFEGKLCAGDSDHRAFDVSMPSRAEITLVADDLSRLEFDLFDAAGARLSGSTLSGGIRRIERTLSPGRYVLRIAGMPPPRGIAYLGEIRLTPSGMACTSTRECPLGSVCQSGTCVSDDCTPPGTCPAMHICPPPGPDGGRSDCLASCVVNADCRSGEACKWFAEGRGCGRSGSSGVGGPCTAFWDCAAQRSCVPWPGGYCARQGCTRSSDCESGTHCIEEGGRRVCALDCSSDPSRCRSGYTCRSRTEIGGMARWVCVP